MSTPDLSPLLPLTALRITLRFTRPTRLRFFHQPALTAFIHTLLSDQLTEHNKQAPWLWLEAPESGRAAFETGALYRFSLFACAGREALLQLALQRLQRLPHSHPGDTSPAGQPGAASSGFGRNLRFVAAHDHFNGNPVRLSKQPQETELANQLFRYDSTALAHEVAFYQQSPSLTLRLLSPARLLLPQPGKLPQPNSADDPQHKQQHKQQHKPHRHDRNRDRKRRRKASSGEARYVRDRGQLSGQSGSAHSQLLGQRLFDSLAAMLRAAGGETSPRQRVPLTGLDDDIGWYDMAYYDQRGHGKPMGGVIGRVELQIEQPDILPLLVLGQHTGIGQRRGFGWGRYRLETASGQGSIPPRQPSRPLLARAADVANLELAWRNQRGHNKNDYYDDHGNADAALAFAEHAGPVDALLAEVSAGLRGDYEVPTLQGRILRQPGKAPRPLAVPPFADRIAQRAVMQILQNDFASLLSDASFGYRRGVSRQQARDRLQQLQRAGYAWVYEADIHSFFDSVSHSALETRLRSLLPDDPVIERLLEWVSAPVSYQGHRIERPAGLPQGSPISPLLANLMLDDFDADLEQLGFKLVRYADDFVIACRSRERAEQAAERACASLREIDLQVNDAKTRITHFDQGFRFLGYTFLGGMALDGAPKRRHPPDTPLQLADIPPASWLARLARREPHILDPANQARQAATPAPTSSEPNDDAIQHLSSSDIVPPPAADPSPSTNSPLPLGEGPGVRANDPADDDQPCILLVTHPRSRLNTRRGRLRVTNPDGDTMEQPWSSLGAVLLLGRHSITGPTLSAALDSDVTIHFATSNGRYQGCLSSNRASGGHQRWLQQQRCFNDPGFALPAARQLVAARIHNQTEVIRQLSRGQQPPDSPLPALLQQLRQLPALLDPASDSQQLNGIEGRAAALYFAALKTLVPPEYDFHKRLRRPPPDPFNALLSLGYTLLYQRTDSVLRAAGLLPEVGLYHQSHGRHAALASDLMEPFRHLVERQALTLLRRGELRPEHFIDAGRDGCRLTRPALRLYLTSLSTRCISAMQSADHDRPMSLYQQLWRNARQLNAALDLASRLQQQPGDRPPAANPVSLQPFRLR